MGRSTGIQELVVRGKRVNLAFFVPVDASEWSVDVVLERDGEEYPESCTAVTRIPAWVSPLRAAKAAFPVLDRLWTDDEDWPNLEPVLKALAGMEEEPDGPFLERLHKAVAEAISRDA